MTYEASGRIIKIFETQSKTATFQAREFVIEVSDGQYPQMVKFQLTQDRCNLIDSFKEGSMVKVSFDIRGREWNGSYFTNLNAWKIEDQSVTSQQNIPPTDAEVPFPDQEPPNLSNNSDQIDEVDDLPF